MWLKKNVVIPVLLTIFFNCISCGKSTSSKYDIKYYEDGTLKSIRTKENKKYNGESLWFYPNGRLKMKVGFKNGKANGNAFKFYESGAIQTHNYWSNDIKTGFITEYVDDTIGIIKSVVLLDENGKLIDIRKSGK